MSPGCLRAEPALSFNALPLIIDTMATAKKKTATAQRSRPTADRTIVYQGIKIPPVVGTRSPLSAVIREALFANRRISGDEPR